jgi:hypothetical protein
MTKHTQYGTVLLSMALYPGFPMFASAAARRIIGRCMAPGLHSALRLVGLSAKSPAYLPP